MLYIMATISVANRVVYPPIWATLKWPAWGEKKPLGGWPKKKCPRQLLFLQICQFPINLESFESFQCPRTFIFINF